MRILLVDDSSYLRKHISKMVEALGYECDFAIHGQEAIDKLSAGEKYDLVLLDWNMPVMTGPEFLAYRQDHPEIQTAPVIMVTTENTPERIGKAMELGASEYLMKPFTEDVLDEKISYILDAA